MTRPVTFDPNGIYARVKTGAAFEVYRGPRFWPALGRFLLQCIGGASFLFIAFGLIAMVQQ